MATKKAEQSDVSRGRLVGAATELFAEQGYRGTSVQQIGERLTRGSRYRYQWHVARDPSLNAFAIPGGHVYVNTGLIKNADNAAELAGVMAHEISHVLARHSTEQISRQYGLSVLAGVVLGQNPGVLQQLAAQIVAGGALARFGGGGHGDPPDAGSDAGRVGGRSGRRSVPVAGSDK